MSKYLFLIPAGIIAGVGGFVAFWCLIVKMLSLVGWQRLAQYEVPRPLPGPRTTVGRATVGGISYKNVLKATAQAEGLSLEAMFLFRVGHPPLLIPWSAIGPVRAEKSFWTTTYTTEIRVSSGSSVSFSFSSAQLATELRSWLEIMGPPATGLAPR